MTSFKLNEFYLQGKVKKRKNKFGCSSAIFVNFFAVTAKLCPILGICVLG